MLGWHAEQPQTVEKLQRYKVSLWAYNLFPWPVLSKQVSAGRISAHLDASKWRRSHVQKDSIQHRHGDELEKDRSLISSQKLFLYNSLLISIYSWKCKEEEEEEEEKLGYTSFFPNLKHRCHEDGAAHQGEDHEAGETLLSDAQELRLLAWGWALWL